MNASIGAVGLSREAPLVLDGGYDVAATTGLGPDADWQLSAHTLLSRLSFPVRLRGIYCAVQHTEVRQAKVAVSV